MKGAGAFSIGCQTLNMSCLLKTLRQIIAIYIKDFY